ncbi:hypothetical protein YC2023_018919 [Brassica napus]
MFLSASLIRQTGVRHSTFESLCLGRSSQSIASCFLASGFHELQERQGVCGNHDVVGQIRSVHGSGLTKEITRVVICLLIDP